MNSFVSTYKAYLVSSIFLFLFLLTPFFILQLLVDWLVLSHLGYLLVGALTFNALLFPIQLLISSGLVSLQTTSTIIWSDSSLNPKNQKASPPQES